MTTPFHRGFNMDLHFDIYHRYDKIGHIDVVDNKIINNIRYKPEILHPFPILRNINALYYFLKERIMSESRWTAEMLESVGESEYNVYNLVKKTHGVDIDDFWWFKFDTDPEDLSFDDVRVR